MKKKKLNCREVAVRELAKSLKYIGLDFETRLWIAKNIFDEREGKPITRQMLITRNRDGTVSREEDADAIAHATGWHVADSAAPRARACARARVRKYRHLN